MLGARAKKLQSLLVRTKDHAGRDPHNDAEQKYASQYGAEKRVPKAGGTVDLIKSGDSEAVCAASPLAPKIANRFHVAVSNSSATHGV
jgi:hypothetical protein